MENLRNKSILSLTCTHTYTHFFFIFLDLFTERACPQLAKANLGGGGHALISKLHNITSL